ncbi:MAG: InlB B-repeat-containing protein [Clostridia bacterium]|nr:InlB B-repeat-containing protein [Clostridia bacterium]
MRKIRETIVVFLVCLSVFSLGACAEKTPQTTDPQTYTIQYADDMGIHSLSVQSGSLYSIDPIPERFGYEFLGLFDAEVGGTQYVRANGSSIAAFTDNKNIVLYPQFKAKEFTLILDYQGADVTGSRSLSVAYNAEIAELPLSLTLEHKNFVGWFTRPNRQGRQIADAFGVLPENRKVTEKVFDLSDPDGYIRLYAGFKGEEFTVTFYFTESSAPEEIQVEYGTPIREVQPKTRVDGKAVLAWSKKRNDVNLEQVFDGKVTSEMILYAAEFAPVLDFDSNGGNKLNALIARAGDAITLPTPTRENYTFKGWQDTSGNDFTAALMPENSLKLTAVWWAQVALDGRGGGTFEAISQEAGTPLALPTPEKDGFIFAGWYNERNEKTELSVMPHESVKLKAMYYAVKTETVTILGSNEISLIKWYSYGDIFTMKASSPTRIDFAEAVPYVDWSQPQNISLQFHVEVCDAYDWTWSEWVDKSCRNAYFDFYSVNNTTSAYHIGNYKYENNNTHIDVWKKISFAMELPIQDGAAYFLFSADFEGVRVQYPGYKYGFRIREFWAEMLLPDLTELV